MLEKKQRLRIAAIAVGVTGLHLWLLAGMPRVFVPSKPVAAWTARTVEAPAAAPPAAAPPPVEPVKRAAVAPPPPAPRKQEPAPAPEQQAPALPQTSAPQVAERALPSASVVASAPAATRIAGAAPSPLVRALVPPSARFSYDVQARKSGIPLSGSARLEFRNDGREYEARLTLSAPFLPTRVEHSAGLVTAQGLAPVRYSHKVRSEEATHFDRENGKVVFSSNRPEAVLEPGVQDRLSIVLQLGALIAGEPSRYREGSHITVQTASTKEAEAWTFTVNGSETLALPGGRVEALRLTRSPRKEYDVKVELWLAPGAAYAPVRLRLTQPNGDWVDQLWSSTDRG